MNKSPIPDTISGRSGAGTQVERAAEYAARHFRWNFAVLVLDASTFFAGLAFLESTTVLPVILHRLGAGDSVIGLARFLQTLGFTLPAILGAHYIHGRRLHKPFLLATCAIGRAGLLTLPLIFLGLAASAPSAALAWFLIVYAGFWLMDGACAVSWFDIVAKTIPVPVRGRFFGVMQMLSGAAAIGTGFAVKVILQRSAFPLSFALLSSGACVGVFFSLLFLFAIREPNGTVEDDAVRSRLPEFIRRAFRLLRESPRLRTLLAIRLLLDGGCMALPFYVLFAEKDLRAGLPMVGVYAVVQSAGKLCGGPLWGWISDRSGPIAGLRAVALSVAVIPVLALCASHGVPSLMLAVFALIGAVQDGVWMVGSTALLAAVSAEERPLAVGIASVCQAPGSLFGLLGGALAAATSYPVVFGFALALAAAAVILTCATATGSGATGFGPSPSDTTVSAEAVERSETTASCR